MKTKYTLSVWKLEINGQPLEILKPQENQSRQKARLRQAQSEKLSETLSELRSIQESTKTQIIYKSDHRWFGQ